MIKRSIFFIFGLMIATFGVTLVIKSEIGAGPWDAFYVGLENNVGLSIGIWIIIVQLLMMILNSWITKKRPEFESAITFVLWGFVMDFWMKIVFDNVTLFTNSYLNQWLFFIAGLIFLSLGIGAYIVSNLPRNPYDSLMVNLSEKFNMSIGIVRTTLEIGAVCIAFIIGGPIGIGTIIIAVSVGYLIQFSNALAQRIYDTIQ